MRRFLFVILIGLIILVSAKTWAASDPDLVIYYSFDKITNTVDDLSGKGNNGTVFGDVKVDAAGKRAGAARFTKTDAGSYIDLNAAKMKASDIPAVAITVCAWLKGETLADMEIFSPRSKTGPSEVNYHAELRTAGTVRWICRSNENVTFFEINTGKWNVNEWIHFAGTYSAAEKFGILYLNGQEIEKKAATEGKLLDWSAGARVGMTVDNARPMIGLMDDFCLYKRALKIDEIKAVMNNGPQIPSAVSNNNSLTTTWGNIKY